MLLCVHCAVAADAVLGTTTELLSSDSGSGACSDESALGDALADAVRYTAGADVAIVCGGDIDGSGLPSGEQTEETIRNAVAVDQALALTQVTPKELYELLEIGVSHTVIDAETSEILHEESEFYGFPQVSGITFFYDAGAPAGSRLLWIKLAGGEKLDPEDNTTELTLAASEAMLSGEYGYPKMEYSDPELTLTGALSQYITNGITTRYASEDRMSIHGTSEDTIITHIPIGILILLVVLFAAGNGVRQMRKNRDERDHDNNPDWGMY